ncbi:hypothetical protein Cgig2_013678 [Carnegiea gigantea]|uniref:Uncharacterized protein n=1 Tax=Carnegiea gigantea TaxID=171969 RepID=A0A9Q1KDA7_9CARY|nr:hypothetical protein Cgig2_013678 [Carnegiea gigantea]
MKVISIGTTNTLGKILKDQKAGRGEKEIVRKKLQLKHPVNRLALPSLGALHGLNCLSHKLGDGPRPFVLTYVKLEVTGHLSLFSRGLPKRSGMSPPPHSWCMKRKSYFQCFTFDFFSMAVMKPGLLLKQYHPKTLVSLGALWMVCTRLSSRTEDNLRVREVIARSILRIQVGWGPGNSDPSATISATNPSGARPFLLSIDLPGADGPSRDEELVDAPSED